jgi:hypothetical protein
MNVKTLMKEYGFELDDIRWYLSWETAVRLLGYQSEPEELARLVWSGRLADELYDMEERFLEELQDKVDRSLTDEHRVRELFAEIEREKRRRRR